MIHILGCVPWSWRSDPAAVQFPPGMAEHLEPWARWLLRLGGLMLACCHLAAQWRQRPQLHDLLPGLPLLRLLPDAAALASLSKVGIFGARPRLWRCDAR